MKTMMFLAVLCLSAACPKAPPQLDQDACSSACTNMRTFHCAEGYAADCVTSCQTKGPQIHFNASAVGEATSVASLNAFGVQCLPMDGGT